MTQNKITYTITKYLAFIAPVILLMIVGLLLFHTLMLAVTFTLIVGVLGLIGLSFYVRRNFAGEVDKAYKKYKK